MSNDFWNLSTGENAATTKTTEFDGGGGNMEPIPDGSSILAMIDEAKWAKTQDGMAEYISLRWTVIQPDGYKNRKVFTKLWVTDADPSAKTPDAAAKKRDKARRMLAAIDANAGGKLTSKPGKPTDDDLGMHLTSKPMVIRVQIWEVEDRQTGERIRGNWVSMVAPKTSELHIAAAAPKKAAKPETFASHAASLESDSIPF
jgi:hypothetical protein